MRSRKYRVITTLERINNRLTRASLRRGWVPSWFVLLETTGRESGQPRHTPVGNGLRPGETVFWLIAAHGDQSDYVRNIKTDSRVRVKVPGRWRNGVATLLTEDDPAARSRTLPHQWDAALGRAMASDPLTIRVDLDCFGPDGNPCRGLRSGVHTCQLGETGLYRETGVLKVGDTMKVPGLPWAAIEVAAVAP